MNEKNLRILVLGSGGREHTLAKICSASPLVDEVLVAPGNGGIQKEFRTLDLSVEDNSKIVEIAKAERNMKYSKTLPDQVHIPTFRSY